MNTFRSVVLGLFVLYQSLKTKDKIRNSNKQPLTEWWPLEELGLFPVGSYTNWTRECKKKKKIRETKKKRKSEGAGESKREANTVHSSVSRWSAYWSRLHSGLTLHKKDQMFQILMHLEAVTLLTTERIHGYKVWLQKQEKTFELKYLWCCAVFTAVLSI